MVGEMRSKGTVAKTKALDKAEMQSVGGCGQLWHRKGSRRCRKALRLSDFTSGGY